jgi:hypothetical protein
VLPVTGRNALQARHLAANANVSQERFGNGLGKNAASLGNRLARAQIQLAGKLSIRCCTQKYFSHYATIATGEAWLFRRRVLYTSLVLLHCDKANGSAIISIMN